MNGTMYATETDETILLDREMPKHWRCPHCKKLQTVDPLANEILMNYGKVLRHCDHCGNVHMWKLTLSDTFKENVVRMLREDIESCRE